MQENAERKCNNEHKKNVNRLPKCMTLSNFYTHMQTHKGQAKHRHILKM